MAGQSSGTPRTFGGAGVANRSGHSGRAVIHSTQMVNDMRKSLFAMASLAILVGLAACSDVVGLGYGSHVGAYDLRTVNGFSLPTVIYDDGLEQDELLSETFTIYAEGSYTDDYRVRVSSRNGQSTSTYRDVGTYTEYNGQLQFVDGRTGEVFNGELNGRTLTMAQGGDFYVYQR